MVAEVETTWFHDIYASGGPTLTALLGFYTWWSASRRAERTEMIETIRRQEEEIRALKEDNERLGRDNTRLLRYVAKLDQHGSH
jgi:hypothetical protein